MLYAILGNKSGRITVKGESIPVKQLYKDREDLLTATVISRLRYLTKETRHKLLSYCLPNCQHDFRHLKSVEYWPRFTSEAQTQVEPDILVHFDWGTLLIEVKRPLDGVHYIEQWLREIQALDAAEIRGGLAFLALGGKNQRNVELLEDLSLQLSNIDAPIQLESADALDWYSFSKNINRIIEGKRQLLSDEDYAVLSDIDKALNLYGVAYHPPLSSLPRICSDFNKSSAVIENWVIHFKCSYWEGLNHFKSFEVNRIEPWKLKN